MTKGKGKPAEGSGEGIAIVAQNRSARRDYEIVETVEAGMVLLGSEVKSIRAGGGRIDEAYVKIIGGKPTLLSSHIAPYEHARIEAHEPARERPLLLHKREIEKLAAKIKLQGLTIVPLKMYFKGGRCKIELGLGKGKKQHDKRQDVKQRQADRAIARVMKNSG